MTLVAVIAREKRAIQQSLQLFIGERLGYWMPRLRGT